MLIDHRQPKDLVELMTVLTVKVSEMETVESEKPHNQDTTN